LRANWRKWSSHFPLGPFSPAWILLAFSAQVANFTTTWNLPPERGWWDEGRCQSYDKEQQDTAEGQKAPLGLSTRRTKSSRKLDWSRWLRTGREKKTGTGENAQETLKGSIFHIEKKSF